MWGAKVWGWSTVMEIATEGGHKVIVEVGKWVGKWSVGRGMEQEAQLAGEGGCARGRDRAG